MSLLWLGLCFFSFFSTLAKSSVSVGTGLSHAVQRGRRPCWHRGAACACGATTREASLPASIPSNQKHFWIKWILLWQIAGGPGVTPAG